MRNDMVGIICAGGLATRLYPLTHATNKHLLPVYDKPMIYYPIQTLVNAGIKDIIIVCGGPFSGHFMGVLKDGKGMGIDHLYYAYQEREGGIAEAISCGEKYAQNKKVAVILGDNCTDTNIEKPIEEFQYGAHIFLKKVPDPQRFGVPVFEGDKIVSIEEKPKNPSSDLAVVGLYLYDETVFGRIKKLTPSQRGELEVTDLNNQYLKEGNLEWSILSGYWRDAGTFDTLCEANKYWYKKHQNT